MVVNQVLGTALEMMTSGVVECRKIHSVAFSGIPESAPLIRLRYAG